MKIEVKPEHIVLLQNTNLQYWDDFVFGSFGQDPKRPYGNSSVLKDIQEIFEEEEGFDPESYSNEQLLQFHEELKDVLRISIQEQTWNIVGSTYKSDDGKSWERVNTLDCSGLEDWGEVLAVVRKEYRNHPMWRLSPSFMKNIFNLTDYQVSEVLDQLEAEGFAEHKVHRRCKECNAGLDFVSPSDAGDTLLYCDICDAEVRINSMDVYELADK